MSTAVDTALDAAFESAIVPARRFVPRQLRAVENGSRRRPRRLYGIVAVAGALAIAALQMFLSILTTQTSYELSTLNREHSELTWQRQILDDELAGLSSPQYLAANATALGMVIDESPSYLRLSDGALLGTGQVSFGGSSVDALGRASVPNELVAQTPLVTSPHVSLQAPVPAPPAPRTDPAGGSDPAAPAVDTPPAAPTPPPMTDGLPTPSTH